MTEVAALVLLAGTLVVAVVRPRGLPEAAGALPAAALTVATGILPGHTALSALRQIGPTVGFLAGVLVLADLSDRQGVFAWAGGWMAARSDGDPKRLLALVFGVASVTTAALSLDATVVLLTPVVFMTAARLRFRERPHLYACAHLANSASLLLPVSNLTNLLALSATGLSFTGFALRMAVPCGVAVGVEWVVFRRYFAIDLALPGRSAEAAVPPLPSPIVIVVLCSTLCGFVLTSLIGLNPAVAAGAGAGSMAIAARRAGRASVTDLIRGINLPFLGFVAALALVVDGAEAHGLGRAVGHLVPSGTSLPALLAVAAIGAVLANGLNNLPAVLILLPVVAANGSAAVLALIVGVNVGPNLTYAGSLATLLWRSALHDRGVEPDVKDFLTLGAISVPVVLAGSVIALWLVLKL